MKDTNSFDLIIVGAGISGIAAARTAQGYGASVLLLEAQSRVGGRAFTDTTTFSEIGFDIGAQYFQQVVSGNELLQIAQARGIPTTIAVGPGGPKQMMFDGDAPASELEADVFIATSAAIKLAVLEAGAKAGGDASKDQSIKKTISGLSSLPYFHLAVALGVDELIGSVENSTIDLANFLLVSPFPFAMSGDDYLTRNGIGSFIASLAEGLNVKLDAPVTSIVRSDLGVVVTTEAGETYSARKVIVTASTGVLAHNGIGFDPPLPSEYVEAFHALPLANCYKCLLGFDPTFTFDAVDNAFSIVLQLTDEDTPTIFPRFWDTNTVEFIASGDFALGLEEEGPEYAASLLLSALDDAFPGAAAAWDGRMTHSEWASNKYVKGAYSGVLPGQIGARTTLAQPIENQLWFAGEAVGAGASRGSLHGAYRAGVAAAHGALQAIAHDDN